MDKNFVLAITGAVSGVIGGVTGTIISIVKTHKLKKRVAALENMKDSLNDMTKVIEKEYDVDELL